MPPLPVRAAFPAAKPMEIRIRGGFLAARGCFDISSFDDNHQAAQTGNKRISAGTILTATIEEVGFFPAILPLEILRPVEPRSRTV